MSKPRERCKGKDGYYYCNHTDEQNKHFIKIMIGDHFHERMTIPEKFVKHLTGKLPRNIKLELCNGCTSDVQVTNNLDKLVLRSGWKEFVTAHDLKMGDFLLFKYDGVSKFKVLIFDPSCCEKVPSCLVMRNATCSQVPVGISSSSHDIPMNSQHSKSSNHGSKIVHISSSSSPSESSGCVSSLKDDLEEQLILPRGTFLTAMQIKKLKEKVQAIYSEIPIYGFVVKRSNIHASCDVKITRKYADVYLPFEEQRMMLHCHGKNWEVQCRVIVGKRKRFETGWKQFAGDNKLRLGDICLLELLQKKNEYTMNVHIMKNATDSQEPVDIASICHDIPMSLQQGEGSPSKSSGYVSSSEDVVSISASSPPSKSSGRVSSSEDGLIEHLILPRRTVLTHMQMKKLKEKVQAIYSETPIYGFVVKKSSIYSKPCTLDISREYAYVYLPFEEQKLTLHRHGKDWEVHCRVSAWKCKRIIKGWKKFARENKLRLGDICLLELMKKKNKYTMNVHIIRKKVKFD